MDIEFIVQDIFALTRPQWKLASNFDEASKAFQLAVAQDQKTSGLDKAIDQDDAPSEASSDDENADDLPDPDGDEESGSEEEEEAEVRAPKLTNKSVNYTNDDLAGQDIEQQASSRDSESEDEAIVVTRQEEEVDPEDEAEFEREYAKMMAESLESRKFDRKPLFDVPLPVRPRTARETTSTTEPGEMEAGLAPTMAFSLLTKRGNRQQVSRLTHGHIAITNSVQTRTLELPSDSHFAVAMKNQQQAEWEEQQRIKNLVLNYDLRENEDQDGDSFLPPLTPNTNIHATSSSGHETKPSTYHHNRADKTGKERGAQRVRKLQVSDLDWYDRPRSRNSTSDSSQAEYPEHSTKKHGEAQDMQPPVNATDEKLNKRFMLSSDRPQQGKDFSGKRR